MVTLTGRGCVASSAHLVPQRWPGQSRPGRAGASTVYVVIQWNKTKAEHGELISFL